MKAAILLLRVDNFGHASTAGRGSSSGATLRRILLMKRFSFLVAEFVERKGEESTPMVEIVFYGRALASTSSACPPRGGWKGVTSAPGVVVVSLVARPLGITAVSHFMAGCLLRTRSYPSQITSRMSCIGGMRNTSELSVP